LGTLAVVQLAFVAVCDRVDRDRERAALPVRMERRSDPAHDLVVEGLGGGQRVVPARSGRFQLVHFWATWCPPCRKELPTLLEMAARNRHRFQVWAITTDHDWRAVRQFIEGDVPSVVVRDPSGAASRSYGVTGLPDSYLVDPRGRIRARFSGAQNWSTREMDKILNQLMLES
jgi:thiol-disulfide isomerase/thioredoxin